MRKSRVVKVKHLEIGGGAPIIVQSMTKTDTTDVCATVAQIEELVRGGCEIVRIAVPDKDAAVALKRNQKARAGCAARRGHTFSLQAGARRARCGH